MRFQAIDRYLRQEGIEIGLGNQPDRVASTRMRDHGDTACLVRGVDDTVHRQVAVEIAADFQQKLGRLFQVLGVPILDCGGEDMERPHRPTVDDRLERRQLSARRLEPQLGIGRALHHQIVDVGQRGIPGSRLRR